MIPKSMLKIPQILLLIKIVVPFLPSTYSIPMTYDIPRNNQECLYDRLARDEYVTMSVFILDGDSLQGEIFIQGPIAPMAVTEGNEIMAAFQRGRADERQFDLFERHFVDYENIYETDDATMFDDDDTVVEDDHMDDITLRDYYYEEDDDDKISYMIDDAMDEEEKKAVEDAKARWESKPAEERERIKNHRREEKKNMVNEQIKARKQAQEEKERKKAEKGKRREQKLSEQQENTNALKEGEPYERSYQIKHEGWYRVCVDATKANIKAEIEMRKSSELGQPNKKTGHLMSYERREMMLEEKRRFERMNAEEEELFKEEEAVDGSAAGTPPKRKVVDGVTKEDLEVSKEQISRLNRLLNEIKEKQINERHRLSVHSATNEHSHKRMVMNSLFETAFYIVISVFQVYTIRRWFRTAPILGY